MALDDRPESGTKSPKSGADERAIEEFDLRRDQ